MSVRASPVVSLPVWANRFFALSEELGVSLCAVFRNQNAAAAAKIVWPDDFRHSQAENRVGEKLYPATQRFYLKPVTDTIGNQTFDLTELRQALQSFECQPDFFQWTLMRMSSIRAFCMRESEIASFVQHGLVPPKWGFGRPHPSKPEFRPHQLLAGPLIDFEPGRAPKEFGDSTWEFEPVFLKLAYAEAEEIILVGSQWNGPSVTFWIKVLAGEELASVPQPVLDTSI